MKTNYLKIILLTSLIVSNMFSKSVSVSTIGFGLLVDGYAIIATSKVNQDLLTQLNLGVYDDASSDSEKRRPLHTNVRALYKFTAKSNHYSYGYGSLGLVWSDPKIVTYGVGAGINYSLDKYHEDIPFEVVAEIGISNLSYFSDIGIGAGLALHYKF